MVVSLVSGEIFARWPNWPICWSGIRSRNHHLSVDSCHLKKQGDSTSQQLLTEHPQSRQTATATLQSWFADMSFILHIRRMHWSYLLLGSTMLKTTNLESTHGREVPIIALPIIAVPIIAVQVIAVPIIAVQIMPTSDRSLVKMCIQSTQCSAAVCKHTMFHQISRVIVQPHRRVCAIVIVVPRCKIVFCCKQRTHTRLAQVLRGRES